MSQALYRKYRSRGFDEIVGQHQVTDLLAAAIKNDSISHAYLFTGPRGTGKTSVARILAHEINKLPYTDDSMHLDIIEIDAASNRRIDDIRELREKVHIAPTSARYKVYIIDEVHMLTGESFNALLKTLEEPPSHAVFILATTELHKVPATIVSRTQRFHFRPGGTQEVIEHLRSIATTEKISIDDAALALIAEHSEGGFRDSVSLLDQVSNISSDTITAETVELLLGLAPHQQIDAVIDNLTNGASDAAITIVHELYDSGTSVQTIISQLVRRLSVYSMTHPELYPLLSELIEVPKSYAPHLKLLAILGQRSQPTVAPVAPVTPSQPPRPTPAPAPTAPAPIAPATNEPKVTPPAPKATLATPSALVTSFSASAVVWDDVLNELKKHAPTLHSVVRRADTTIEDAAITMKFTFALHRKKLQDEKHHSMLSGVIIGLYGSCPQIIVLDAKASLDSTAQTVAELMGGGEAVAV